MKRTPDDIWVDDADPAFACNAYLTRNRRIYRIKMVVAVGVSYFCDTALLALFWLAGVIDANIPMIYLGLGLVHVLLFTTLHWFGISDRAENPHLTSWQMVLSISIQLTMIVLAPQIKAFFLAIIFIIYGFGTLRLKLRDAILVWLLTSVAIAITIQYVGNVIVHDAGSTTPLHGFAIWFSFALILLRTMLLGYYGSHMRDRMLQLNSRLTEHVESSEERAIRDELTGALNRHALMPLINEYLQLSQRKGMPCTIALLDIDHFKSVNDHFGHLAGDNALIFLVAFINRYTRISDKVGRFGGEEFLILMPATPLDEGAQLAERLRAGLALAPLDHIVPELHLTISIGVTNIGPQDTFERIIERVDSCLYQAKNEGRNRVVWTEAPEGEMAS